MLTILILLSVVFAQNFHVHQMDVQNAFLYTDLREEMDMRPFPGFCLQYQWQEDLPTEKVIAWTLLGLQVLVTKIHLCPLKIWFCAVLQ